MRLLLWILGVPAVANGIWMLVGPASWYHGLPGEIPDTGPLNLHFVRDIGAAYVTAGLALCAVAERPQYRRAAVSAAAVFYGLHAAIHVADLATGRLSMEHWLMDAPGVFLPAALLAVWSLPRWWSTDAARNVVV